MTENNLIADRHSLKADGLRDSLRGQAQNVRIILDEVWAGSVAGQLLVSCLVNLLVRQVRVVGSVEVISPRAPRLVLMPYVGASNQFPECLTPMGKWAVNGAVAVRHEESSAAVDFTVVIGDLTDHDHRIGDQAICALGCGWVAWVGDQRRAPQGVRPTSACPLGPFLAAALVAGEIFKRGRGLIRGRFLDADGYSLWTGCKSSNWNALHQGPETGGVCLPPIHIAGAGAVGNAFAYTIANLGVTDAYLIPIDDDHYDETNLNRCLLAGWIDLNDKKVRAMDVALKRAGIGSFQFEGSVSDYVSKERIGLRGDVAQEVKNLHFGIVASCVDKGTSRQDIQGLIPALLVGASTLDLRASSNLYNAYPGSACLACFNPKEKDGDRIRELEAMLRKMSPDIRVNFLQENGLDAIAINEYLSGARCGSVGEAAIKSFATKVPAQFSAGFVSLGAGLLLTATLLRQTVFAGQAPAIKVMTALNFLNGGLLDSGFGADHSCELGCREGCFSVQE